MLRFLQYKTFGSHPVPDGWVIVAAGNPPEYNKSVKEYDIATLDRIQKIDVTADYGVWRDYAINEKVHPSIITYLDSKPTDFYIVENTPDGKQFVTARGWEDLSRLMYSFEKKNIEIDAEFISQYIQVPTVAGDFSSFYKTFKNMKEMCSPKSVLEGTFDENLKEKFKTSGVEEKLGFINLLSNTINDELSRCVEKNTDIKETVKFLKDNDVFSLPREEAVNTLKNNAFNTVITAIKSSVEEDELSVKEVAESELRKQIENLKSAVSVSQKMLSNASRFIYDSLGDSPELKIFSTDITRNDLSAGFLIGFGCDDFSEITKTTKSDKELLSELDKIL